MQTTITLEGEQYEKGSTEHLEKIREMHGAEIAAHDKVHEREATDRQALEDRARFLKAELEQGIRAQAAALADASAAMQDGEDLFLRLVKGVKDYALYTLDASGNVASWNAGAELVEGYAAEEILGKPLSTFYQPADAESGHAQKNLLAAAETGSAEEEGWRVRKDGSKFWANVVLSSIRDNSGALIGFAKITRDLTESRKWEEQLRQAKKLEAIGGLAAGIAHDFNNLLSVILSYSELLTMDTKDDDPKHADLLEVRNAGMQAATLVRQLLAFGRQEVLQPVVVDLCAIVARMQGMLRRVIREDVELVCNIEPVSGRVLVDPGQVEQVLMNLTVNARDAMPSGGTLTIEAAEVALDAQFAAVHPGVTAGPHVLLSVRDTGIGMDAATQARIFEPFFTTKGFGKGTGIGLATVFAIVKAAGGTIWVQSEPGRGTTVQIYVPMVDQAAVVVSPSFPPDSEALHGTETVLLVEDDERVRIVVRTILRRYGYNVIDAQGGGDALLLCEQCTAGIDLLLTDVVMPRMSGRQLAERLLKVRPK